MGIVWNYIRCIHWIRSTIWPQTNLVWRNTWKNISWHVVIRMWWNSWIRVYWNDWIIIIIRMINMYTFSIHTPWNFFLRKPWVLNVYSDMVICRKLAGVIHIPTPGITLTIKTRCSNIITWMMGGRRAGPRPKSTSPNSIKTFSNI